MKHTPDPMLEGKSNKAKGKSLFRTFAFCLLPFFLLATAGCSNNHYPPDEARRPILYRLLPDDP